MKKYWVFVIILAVPVIFLCLNGCSKKAGTDEEAAQEEEQPTEEAEEPTAKPPEPKMNEDVYVQIKARSALIYEKYKEEPEQAQKEIEALYGKFGVTNEEYKTFVSKLSPLRVGELERKVMDYMQKVAPEYR